MSTWLCVTVQLLNSAWTGTSGPMWCSFWLKRNAPIAAPMVALFSIQWHDWKKKVLRESKWCLPWTKTDVPYNETPPPQRPELRRNVALTKRTSFIGTETPRVSMTPNRAPPPAEYPTLRSNKQFSTRRQFSLLISVNSATSPPPHFALLYENVQLLTRTLELLESPWKWIPRPPPWVNG